MKIYGIPRINALGLKGPEETPKLFEKEFNIKSMEIDNGNIEKSEEEVYKKAKNIFKENKKAAFLGGDHSITYPLFKAFSKNKPYPFLIVFDAHADCMPPLKEPTHEEFLRGLIERGHNPEKIIIIGLRKVEPEEEKFIKENNITTFENLENLDEIKKVISKKTAGHEVYLSLDIDALDPKYSPAVNYPEKNGLNPEEFHSLIDFITTNTKVTGLDLVEIIPKKDIENKTLEITKELLKKIKKI